MTEACENCMFCRDGACCVPLPMWVHEGEGKRPKVSEMKAVKCPAFQPVESRIKMNLMEARKSLVSARGGVLERIAGIDTALSILNEIEAKEDGE